jgi:hypothetical protein
LAIAVLDHPDTAETVAAAMPDPGYTVVVDVHDQHSLAVEPILSKIKLPATNEFVEPMFTVREPLAPGTRELGVTMPATGLLVAAVVTVVRISAVTAVAPAIGAATLLPPTNFNVVVMVESAVLIT